ncbi:uncharacterized protein METZ01_LOCUS392487 [marine metagenome]|uniref:Uncharacterized protein n=1 Tax=marine metagenome TaxID=408172 RepID=A0A382UZG3_9ZZZZ
MNLPDPYMFPTWHFPTFLSPKHSMISIHTDFIFSSAMFLIYHSASTDDVAGQK